MIDDLFTERIDVLSITATRDAAGGQIRTPSVKYSNLPARHEEGQFFFNDPNEIGGAPTLTQGHRFFLRDPGPIITSDVIVDERGRLIRESNVGKRRAIGTMPEFIVATAKETQGGDQVATFILLDQDGDPVRDQDGELVLT